MPSKLPLRMSIAQTVSHVTKQVGQKDVDAFAKEDATTA
jgi:hypothetical protein